MIETKPDVSVILPVYNGERFLSRSITSVLEQKFTNFEFLIADDGSTDLSREIIAEYKDPRIRALRNSCNLGLFRTINLLIRESQGDLIHLWSQDDIMKPDCLAEQTDFHKRNDVLGMSYCACDIIDEHGNLIATPGTDPTPEIVSPALAAQIMFYYCSIAGNIANVMVRKSALQEVGPFREDMIIAGDFDMWVRLSERFPIGFHRKPLILLRSHSRQLSRSERAFAHVMREEGPIVEALLRRLPPRDLAYAVRYNRRRRHLAYVHSLMRTLLAGRWGTAAAMLKTLSALDADLRLLLLEWALTLNNRLFRLKPRIDWTQTPS